jgi:hypothetical protein
MDYAMPRAENFPALKVGTTTTKCPSNPLGIKGCGEAGAIAAPAAVINAINGVIEQPGYETTSVQTAPTQSPAIGQRTSPDSDPVAPPVVNISANPVAAEGVQRRKDAAEDTVILPAPAPAAAVVDAEASLPGIARGADQTAVPVRNPVRSGPVNDIVKDARTQTEQTLRNAADTVRHAAGRAARAVAGPAGD